MGVTFFLYSHCAGGLSFGFEENTGLKKGSAFFGSFLSLGVPSGERRHWTAGNIKGRGVQPTPLQEEFYNIICIFNF